MGKGKPASPIESAASALRDMAIQTTPGELIGSEDEILERLDVSRVTARQAARLLEREGVLLVKRGKKGGYFAARPSFEMVEDVVCAYLDTLGIGASHTGGVATALWVEAVREATIAERSEARETAATLRAMVEQVPDDAPMSVIGRLEAEFRAAVFNLIHGDYMRMIFQINAAFSRKKIVPGGGTINGAQHGEFVRKWRSGKLLQAEAIASGDTLQGIMAALYERRAWVDRGIASSGIADG